MMIPKDLIETAWRRYEFEMTGSNIDPSKLDFFLGFGSAVGMILGTMDFGIPPNTPPGEIMAQLMLEFFNHAPELKKMELEARDRTLRLSITLS